MVWKIVLSFLLLQPFIILPARADYILLARTGFAQWECSTLSLILDNGKNVEFLFRGLENVRLAFEAAISGKVSKDEESEFSRLLNQHELGLSVDFLMGAIWANTSKEILDLLPKPDWNKQTFEDWKILQQRKAQEEYDKRNCDLLPSN